MIIRTAPNTRDAQRYDRPGPPSPRQQVAYHCARGHDFQVTFAADAEPPQAWECRCGAQAGTHVPDDDDRDRHRRAVLERRPLAELEQMLTERLTEIAAKRAAAQAMTTTEVTAESRAGATR